MTVALKKADGDLYIDPETGRSVEITGPTKVDQEMFSNYTTFYDPIRKWGSRLDLKYLKGINSLAELRSFLYNELQAANTRHLQKQVKDTTLDVTEKINKFNQAQVVIDPSTQSGLFISSASVGDPNTLVGQQLFLSFKPLSIRHVLPPLIPSGLLPPKGF